MTIDYFIGSYGAYLGWVRFFGRCGEANCFGVTYSFTGATNCDYRCNFAWVARISWSDGGVLVGRSSS